LAASIEGVQTNADCSKEGELNCMYSPKVFSLIDSFIHLYPRWAAALHENVERFATDREAGGKSDETSKPELRTNAVIESHSKSVKHSKKNRRKIRPHVFVKGRLKSVVARANEMAIKFPFKRKQTSYVAENPSSATEM
jgi:hypothetical protein